MSRTTIARLVAAVILTEAAIAQAQSITIDFEELAQADGSSVYVANSYAVDGYVFTSNIDPILSDQAFGTWGDGDPNFNGSAALFNTFAYGLGDGATTTVTRADGTAFALESIDLGQLFADSGSDTPVVFVGTKSDGTSVTTTFTLPSVLAPATYSFQGAFADLLSVRWEQLPQYHQFDNVVLVSAAVPEPATFWLVALGCGLLVASLGLRQREADSRASLSPIPASTTTPTISTAHSDQRR